MKSLIAILFLPLIFFAISHVETKQELPFASDYARFVVNRQIEGFDCLRNGEQYIIDIYSDIEKFYNSYCNEIVGVNLYFKSLDINQFQKNVNGRIFKTQEVEEMQMYQGYTNLYKDFRYVNGKKINIQIAVKENEVIVGFPLILTGF